MPLKIGVAGLSFEMNDLFISKLESLEQFSICPEPDKIREEPARVEGNLHECTLEYLIIAQFGINAQDRKVLKNK